MRKGIFNLKVKSLWIDLENWTNAGQNKKN